MQHTRGSGPASTGGGDNRSISTGPAATTATFSEGGSLEFFQKAGSRASGAAVTRKRESTADPSNRELHSVPTDLPRAGVGSRASVPQSGTNRQSPPGILSTSTSSNPGRLTASGPPVGLAVQTHSTPGRTVKMAPHVAVRQMRESNDFGERKSAVGSVSSGTSSRLSSQLSRAMQLQEGLVEPEVGSARCLVWSLVAFIVFAAVASIVWSLSEGRATLRTAEALYLSGQRVVKFESAVAWIESLAFYNDRDSFGLSQERAMQVFGHPNRTADALVKDAELYAAVQKELSADADRYGPHSLELLEQMETTIFEVNDPISVGNISRQLSAPLADTGTGHARILAALQSAGREVRSLNISLSQAGSYVATKLFLIADLPQHEIILSNRKVAGLLLSLKNIINGMQLYTESLKEDLLWRFPRQRNIMTGFGAGVFVLVVVCVGGSFARTVRQIKTRIDANAQGLLIIPHNVTKMLHKRA